MPLSSRRLLVPFACCVVLALVLVPSHDGVRWGDIVGSLILLAAGTTGLGAVTGREGRRPLAIASLLALLGCVALLRAGIGATSGFGPMVFVPVLWAALERRRVELAVVVVGTAAVFFLPPVIAPGAQFPTSAWRGGLLMVVFAGAIGLFVLSLVDRVRTEAGRSAAILSATREGFVLIRDGEIAAVNPALCAITGFTADALVGCRPPFPFCPPESRADYAALGARVTARRGEDLDIELQRADGSRFPAHVSVVPTDLGDGSRCFLNTVRDVTDERAHQAAQRRHAEQLAAIADVIREIGHCDPLAARPTICRTALAVCDGAHRVTVWESDSSGGLVATASWPDDSATLRVAATAREHGTHVAMTTGRPLFVAEAADSPHCDARVAERLGSASVFFHPIADPGGVRGVLVISWPEARAEMTDSDALLVGVLAGEAAVAMQRADLLGRLDELTRTDELTGLPNRRAWDELLTHELAVAARQGRAVSVAMLDLDFFKQYNDEHGHLAGDRLLRAAAAAWQSTLRSADMLARWGGEEFALMLPDCDGAGAAALVERLRGTLPDGVTFSAGVASAGPRSSARALIDAADQALYEAKAGGRDRVVVG